MFVYNEMHLNIAYYVLICRVYAYNHMGDSSFYFCWDTIESFSKT